MGQISADTTVMQTTSNQSHTPTLYDTSISTIESRGSSASAVSPARSQDHQMNHQLPTSPYASLRSRPTTPSTALSTALSSSPRTSTTIHSAVGGGGGAPSSASGSSWEIGPRSWSSTPPSSVSGYHRFSSESFKKWASSSPRQHQNSQIGYRKDYSRAQHAALRQEEVAAPVDPNQHDRFAAYVNRFALHDTREDSPASNLQRARSRWSQHYEGKSDDRADDDDYRQRRHQVRSLERESSRVSKSRSAVWPRHYPHPDEKQNGRKQQGVLGESSSTARGKERLDTEDFSRVESKEVSAILPSADSTSAGIETVTPSSVSELKRQLWDDDEQLQVSVRPSLHDAGGDRWNKHWLHYYGPEMAGKEGQRMSRSLSPKPASFRRRFHYRPRQLSDSSGHPSRPEVRKATASPVPSAAAQDDIGNIQPNKNDAAASSSGSRVFQSKFYQAAIVAKNGAPTPSVPCDVDAKQPVPSVPSSAEPAATAIVDNHEHSSQRRDLSFFRKEPESSSQPLRSALRRSTPLHDNLMTSPKLNAQVSKRPDSPVNPITSRRALSSNVARLVAKLNAVNRDDPRQALEQIDSILRAESRSSSGDPAAPNWQDRITDQHQEEIDDSGEQEEEENGDVEDDADDETSVSSITNPTYQSATKKVINSVQYEEHPMTHLSISTASFRRPRPSALLGYSNHAQQQSTTTTLGGIQTRKRPLAPPATIKVSNEAPEKSRYSEDAPETTTEAPLAEEHPLQPLALISSDESMPQPVTTPTSAMVSHENNFSMFHEADASEHKMDPFDEQEHFPSDPFGEQSQPRISVDVTDSAAIAEKIRGWDEMSRDEMSNQGKSLETATKSSVPAAPQAEEPSSGGSDELGSLLTPPEVHKTTTVGVAARIMATEAGFSLTARPSKYSIPSRRSHPWDEQLRASLSPRVNMRDTSMEGGVGIEAHCGPNPVKPHSVMKSPAVNSAKVQTKDTSMENAVGIEVRPSSVGQWPPVAGRKSRDDQERTEPRTQQFSELRHNGETPFDEVTPVEFQKSCEDPALEYLSQLSMPKDPVFPGDCFDFGVTGGRVSDTEDVENSWGVTPKNQEVAQSLSDDFDSAWVSMPTNAFFPEKSWRTSTAWSPAATTAMNSIEAQKGRAKTVLPDDVAAAFENLACPPAVQQQQKVTSKKLAETYGADVPEQQVDRQATKRSSTPSHFPSAGTPNIEQDEELPPPTKDGKQKRGFLRPILKRMGTSKNQVLTSKSSTNRGAAKPAIVTQKKKNSKPLLSPYALESDLEENKATARVSRRSRANEERLRSNSLEDPKRVRNPKLAKKISRLMKVYDHDSD